MTEKTRCPHPKAGRKATNPTHNTTRRTNNSSSGLFFRMRVNDSGTVAPIAVNHFIAPRKLLPLADDHRRYPYSIHRHRRAEIRSTPSRDELLAAQAPIPCDQVSLQVVQADLMQRRNPRSALQHSVKAEPKVRGRTRWTQKNRVTQRLRIIPPTLPAQWLPYSPSVSALSKEPSNTG